MVLVDELRARARHVIGPVLGIVTFARGRGIRELARLNRTYGRASWRKRKGVARIRLADDSEHIAELHWYEAHGYGRREVKIKKLIRELS